MTDVSEKQSTLGPFENANALHAEYIATTGGTAKNSSQLRQYLTKEESYGLGTGKADADTRGDVYSSFLSALQVMHSGDLTHEQIHNDRHLPVFTDQEKKMLEFTDTHFDQISSMRNDGNTPKVIDNFDRAQLRDYPKAKLEDASYVDRFAEHAGWTGAAIGTGAEVATFALAPPVGIVASVYGAPIVGGAIALSHDSLTDGIVSTVATSVAWGPLLGGLAGYGIGRVAAEPYWNMTKGRSINKLYKQMDMAIPTYSQFADRDQERVGF